MTHAQFIAELVHSARGLADAAGDHPLLFEPGYPPSGTNWGQAFVTAIVALLVGGLSFWNGRQGLKNQSAALVAAQEQQDRSLLHDREMRVRDEARAVLAVMIARLDNVDGALRDARQCFDARVRTQLGEDAGTDKDAERLRRIQNADTQFRTARRAAVQQSTQLRLYFEDDDPVAREYIAAEGAITLSYAQMSTFDPWLDIGELIAEQNEALQTAVAAIEAFEAVAHQYTRGSAPTVPTEA